jgi:hypothetical protein
MIQIIWDMIVATSTTALILLLEHWIPYRTLFGKEPGLISRYVMGTLGLVIPLSGLMVTWANWAALVAIWILVIAGGLVTMGAHAIDNYTITKLNADINQHENNELRRSIDEQSPRTH